MPAVPDDAVGEWNGKDETCFVVRVAAEFKASLEVPAGDSDKLDAVRITSGMYFRVTADGGAPGTLFRQEPSEFGRNTVELWMWQGVESGTGFFMV